MNESRLLVEELDGLVHTRGASLETVLNLIQLGLVLLCFMEPDNAQSILVCNFRLQDDLRLL